jgi:hypothetical protein
MEGTTEQRGSVDVRDTSVKWVTRSVCVAILETWPTLATSSWGTPMPPEVVAAVPADMDMGAVVIKCSMLQVRLSCGWHYCYWY